MTKLKSEGKFDEWAKKNILPQLGSVDLPPCRPAQTTKRQLILESFAAFSVAGCQISRPVAKPRLKRVGQTDLLSRTARPHVSERQMAETKDAIVIRAGLNGAATAYFLARLGIRNVMILDAELPGSGASGAAVGLLRTHCDNRPEA